MLTLHAMSNFENAPSAHKDNIVFFFPNPLSDFTHMQEASFKVIPFSD
jgi:hypothetical protein